MPTAGHEEHDDHHDTKQNTKMSVEAADPAPPGHLPPVRD